MLLLLEQLFGVIDQALPVSEEDVLELVWVAPEVAEQGDAVVELAQVCVLADRRFNDPVLDRDRYYEQLPTTILGVWIDMVPPELMLARGLLNLLICGMLSLVVLLRRDHVHVIRAFISLLLFVVLPLPFRIDGASWRVAAIPVACVQVASIYRKT